MRRLLKLKSSIASLVDIASAVLIVTIACLVFFQVIARYALALAAPWAEELLRLLFVWLIMLATCNSRHLRLDLFEHGKVRGGRLLGAVGNAICLIILLVLGYGISEMIALTAYDRYASLDLSVQWAFYGAGIGIALWFLRVVWDFFAGIVGGPEDNT